MSLKRESLNNALRWGEQESKMHYQSNRLSKSLVHKSRAPKNLFFITSALAIFTLVGPTQLIAQSSDTSEATAPDLGAPELITSETVTVTANRDPAPRSRVGSSVTVVTREEIERRNPLFLADILRTIPGVEVTQTGGPGQVSSVRLRGGTAAQVLVLVDGVRANTTNNGDVDLAHLDALAIERIEVLRGPQATYGSEAMSGVISVTTKTSLAELAERSLLLGLTAEAGSRDHQRSAANIGGRIDLFDFHLAVSDLTTDSVSQLAPPSDGATAENDPFDLQTLAARAGLEFAKAGRLELRVRDYQGDTAVDGFGVEDFNALATTEGSTASVRGDFMLTQDWHQTASVGSADTDLFGKDPDTFFNNYTIRSENLLVETQADIDVSASHLLNIGLSHEQRRGENLGSFRERAELDSVFVQDQWRVNGSFDVTAAVRHDDHSVFGEATSFRITGVTSFANHSGRLRASYGTAFRAPNFNELYFPFAGDENLLPETSEGWDLGWSQNFSGDGAPGGRGITLEVTAFHLRFEDLIQFDLTSFLFANIAEAESSGVEFAAMFSLGSRATAQLGHVYNDTENRTTGEQLARRPRNRSTLLLQWSARSESTSVAANSPWAKLLSQRTSAALSAVSVRNRVDSSGATMDNYVRVDVTATLGLTPWLSAFVRAENALDRDYQEVPGFTTPGATFVGGVRLRY